MIHSIVLALMLGYASVTLAAAPDTPALVAPADNASGASTSPLLQVGVSDPDGDPVTVTWYGRLLAPPGPDFTLIGLPDTQYYTGVLNGGTNAIFKTQTKWIVDQRANRNIVDVVHLGDCTQNGDNGGNPIEWQRADTAMRAIENPATGLPAGIPYGICVGNHDQTPEGDASGPTTLYNQYFGVSRFASRSYYGGHYGSKNENHYHFFSASGLDFIVLFLEYDTTPDAAVLDWADNVLAAYPNRRAIVASHYIINAGNPGSFGPQGQAIYDALKDRPNLFLMLCGHVTTPEGRRVDVFEGRTVYTVLSDYQNRSNGGNGWLRIYEFSPAHNVIRVRTYSPTLGQFEADADSSSQFTLPYDMGTGGAFTALGSRADVPPGTNAALQWTGLMAARTYEWYAVVQDRSNTVTGPTWRFTTTAVASRNPDDGGPAIGFRAFTTPNPARADAMLMLSTTRTGFARAAIYDIAGRELAVPLDERSIAPGTHVVHIACRALRPGLYFYRVITPEGALGGRFAVVD